jgi:hypothetical protein
MHLLQGSIEASCIVQSQHSLIFVWDRGEHDPPRGKNIQRNPVLAR